MNRWFGPSLLRRIVFALLAATALVWVAVSLKDFLAFKHDVQYRVSLGRITSGILVSIKDFDSNQAYWALKAADRYLIEMRHQAEQQSLDSVLLQLNTRDGALVYRSGGATQLQDFMNPANLDEVTHQGVRYWPVLQKDERWQLAVWAPVVTDATALTLIGQEVLIYVLLALPLVVLPLVLAVWLGLRPLRLLTGQIALRAKDDFSALQEPTGYAELRPLVDAGNALLERVRRQREIEQAFVQDAAHELKTPFAVLAAQAHVLAASQDDAQRREALQALEQGVQRASHQVNQLLTLAALEQNAQKEMQPVDLVEIVQGVLIELEPLARQKAVDLTLQSPEHLWDQMDLSAFRLVLVNLVLNAIQHGGAAGGVEVGLRRDRASLCLVVMDDGPGIEKSEWERVFDRFYRAKNSSGSGSGLGLAIVRRSAQRFGANVKIVDATRARGTQIEVIWPATMSGE